MTTKNEGKAMLLDSVKNHLARLGVVDDTVGMLLKSIGEAFDVGYIYGLSQLKELNADLDTPEVLRVVLRESQEFVINALQEENANLRAQLVINKVSKPTIN